MDDKSRAYHADRAADHAERAGGYLQAAEQALVPDLGEKDGQGEEPLKAQAYAQMATASATLSLAQRVAANG